MKIELRKIPKNSIIIEGFPGFGLIGTITTEYLIEYLKAEQIGEFIYDELPATAAIHKGKLVRPMAVYHDKKHNLVILHTILNTKGKEWQIADAINDLAKKIKAKEIISVEGVATVMQEGGEEDHTVYSYGNKKLATLTKPINESIIVGVTAALMLKRDNVSCILAGTNTQLPDSKGAAKVIEILDKHLGLGIDTAPLLKQAEEFEGKVKGLMKSANTTEKDADKKALSYLG